MVYFLFFLTLFGISFAFIESSVVVYLRELYYSNGSVFPLNEIPEKILKVEILREFFSLILIFSASVSFGKSRILKIASFFYIFGVWDIFYYVFLYIFLKWPKNLFEWDILFLIPAPWIAPVYAPILCSLSFIIFGIFLFHFWKEGYPVPIELRDWVFFIVSCILILSSFFYETKNVINGLIPQKFPLILFFSGIILFNLFWIIKLKKIHTKCP